MARRTGTLGREVLDLDVDDSAFHSKLSGAYKATTRFAEDAGGNLMKAGKAISGVGESMTRNITLPLLAAGGAVTHFALDFDTTMRRIVGLAKVPAEEIAGIKDEVMALAGETGRAPQELGEALYFVASAGFKADEALEVLRIAAKAAASGMGQTQDIAKVLGGVINAYGHENITAAHAGDVLTAAIQDGAAEASAFAGVIGFVVPVAASLGVSFDQVAAAISAMTQVGISADTAATNLGQVMAALQKPTKEAEEAMEGLGLSSAGLRQELKEKGLLATLRTLEERFAGNEEASAKVFGNIRALRGVTALLGLDSQQLNGIFGDTATALGNLQGAYEATEGPQRELDRAMAKLQVSAIELGAEVLPVVVDVVGEIADAVGGLAAWWETLDKDTKNLIVTSLAWLAIAGPILVIVGKLTSGLGAMFKTVGFLAGAKGIPRLIAGMKNLNLASIGAAGGIGLVVAGLLLAADAWGTYMQEQRPVAASFIKLGLASGKFYDKISHTAVAAARELGISVDEVQRRAVDYAERTGAGFDDAMKAVLDGTDTTFHKITEQFNRLGQDTSAAIREGGGAIKDAAGELPLTVSAELVDGQFVVSEGADEGLVDPIDEALQKAVADAGKRAQEIIDALASTLADGPDQIKDELKALREALENPYTTIEREADLQTALANKAVAANLKTGDKQTEALAAQQVENWLDQYKLLEPGVFNAAFKVNPAFQSGVDKNLDATVQWMQDNVTGPIADKFDLADVLDAAGYDGLAAYVRGMERARLGQLAAEIADTVNQVKHDLSETGDIYYAGRLITSTWMKGILAGIQDNKYLLSLAVWDIRNYLGHSLPTEGPLAGDASQRGGLSIGDQWISAISDAIAAGLRALQGDVGTVANALAMTPRIQMPEMPGLSGVDAVGVPAVWSGAGSATTPAVTGDTYNLNVTGRVSVDDARDAITELRRLAGIKV